MGQIKTGIIHIDIELNSLANVFGEITHGVSTGGCMYL